MSSILSKFLKKVGVNEFAELSVEEKETYRKWEEILSGKKITDKEVKVFLDTELDLALNKLSPTLSPREDCFIKMKIEFIRKVTAFLMAPEIEKQTLENNIKQIL